MYKQHRKNYCIKSDSKPQYSPCFHKKLNSKSFTKSTSMKELQLQSLTNQCKKYGVMMMMKPGQLEHQDKHLPLSDNSGVQFLERKVRSRFPPPKSLKQMADVLIRFNWRLFKLIYSKKVGNCIKEILPISLLFTPSPILYMCMGGLSL